MLISDTEAEALVETLRDGLESTNPILRRRAEKMTGDLFGLRSDLVADRECDAIRREIADLERQLADKRRVLLDKEVAIKQAAKERAAEAANATDDEYDGTACRSCDKELDSVQGRKIHEATVHGIRGKWAAKKQSSDDRQCSCGRQFSSPGRLAQHQRFCSGIPALQGPQPVEVTELKVVHDDGEVSEEASGSGSGATDLADVERSL